MKKTIFAGLTVLDGTESINSDNAAFIGRDRTEIDRGLKIGIKTHRHDGTSGLLDPVIAPSGEAIPTGGTIPGDLSISLGYTLVDEDGGETLLSPTTTVTTQGALDIPLVAPVGEFDSAAGSLMIDTYTYALTYADGEGGETPVGPSITVERPPGFANGQIELSGLDAGMAEAGAAGWRLYRARGAGAYVLLTTGIEGEGTFIDDGSVEPDCNTNPPTDNINTTNQANQLKVTIPNDVIIEAAVFINLYGSLTGAFGEASLLATYPVGSAGSSDNFTSFEPFDQQPPDVNRSYGGANQIDPDVELLDWHWKRAVAASGDLPEGEEGDVRMVLDTSPPAAYFFHNGEWEIWTGGVGEKGEKGDPGTPGSAAVGPWVKMTAGLQGAWVGTSSPQWPPAYRIYGDKVEFAGGLASGSNGSLIYTFPPEARPQANVRIGFGEGVSNAGITIEVKTNGELICVNRNGAIAYLTGLSFPLSMPP